MRGPRLWALLAWVVLGAGGVSGDVPCPATCACRADWSRVKCGSPERPLLRLDDVDFAEAADLLTNLNLSDNAVTVLTKHLHLPALQKLDLSRNRISSIELDAFYNLTSLQRLDLSNNSISVIEKDTFKGLVNLKQLLLNANQISNLPYDTFDHLVGLKNLDISANPLKCNCDLSRIVEWARNANVKILANPKCANPDSLEEQNVKKLKNRFDPMTCSISKTILHNALLLKPQNSQVVFEGDSLKLSCKAPFSTIKTIYNLTWVLPPINLDAIEISNVDILKEGLAETVLFVSKLSTNHTGQYTCTYSKHNATDLIEDINIIVISNTTQYCPTAVTSDNKGVYTWPGSIRGNFVSQSCYHKEGAVAYYFCGDDGGWSQLNTSECPYASETTRMLEQFSLINHSLLQGSVMGTCQKLHTLLLQNVPPNGGLSEPDDINFIVKTINNFIKYAETEKSLGSVLLDIINTMMILPRAVLIAAENVYNSCSDLITTVENLSQYASNLQGHKKNLAIEQFTIKREGFKGMTCVWYTMPSITNPSEPSRRFHCSTTNRTITPLLAERNKVIEASVQIPGTLLYRLDHQPMSALGTGNIHRSYNLVVTMFDKASFFTNLPAAKTFNQSSVDYRLWDYYGNKIASKDVELAITTPVVGVKLLNMTLVNPLAEPIYVMVRDTSATAGIGGRAVLWDERTKRWTDSPEGCIKHRVIANMVVIQCYKLGYVGLMQSVETGMHSGRSGGARFKFSHPAIYVGSAILSICLLVSILTYIVCYSAIHMTVRAKHSLINMWSAMSLLCFMYTLGIFQTEDVQLCQGIGLLIHYLTLSCLLWITVAVSQLYKNLSKNHSPTLQSPEDDLPSDVPIQKPILGIYLVGWGIALIVCGISGAVNMKDYASYSHCFLENAPALSAVFVPAGIIVVFISILFLLIRCTVRHVNGQLSEGTQATENVDLEMWEPSLLVNNTADRRSEHSGVESEVEDIEHAPIVQLRAHVIVLCAYLATWGSGCIAVYHPFSWYFVYQEDVFSVLYALFAAILGTFILFFYGVARSDVRSQWLLMKCYFRRRKKCCRTRSVFDTNAQNMPSNHHPLAPISNAAAAQARSRSSSQNSNRTNSKSNNSNILKAAAELNGHTLGDPSANGNKLTNMNLVVLHRQQYRSNNSVITFPESGANCAADIFYNANQSNAARKFFKKQRKNVRRNCLDIPRRHNFDSDSQVSSSAMPSMDNEGVSSMLSSGSKVNNTNIHVDRDHLSDNGIKEPRNQLNPNILSDNDDSSNKHLKRYVIEKDINKLKSLDAANPVIMNIYTNIPETKVPQHQVVSSVKMKQRSSYEKGNKLSQLSSISGDGFDCKGSAENLPTMRTVSQQCSLEYSSTSEVATPLNQLGSDKTLNTHSELTSLQETHSALCTSDTDEAPSFDKYIDFSKANASRKSLQGSKQHTSCSKLQCDCEEKDYKRTVNRSLQDINIQCKIDSKDETKRDGSNVVDSQASKSEYESCVNASERNFENESDIYFPNYQMSEVSIRSHGLYAPPPTTLSAKDLGLNFSNSELSHNHHEDEYENQYVNYNPMWKRANANGADLRYQSPAVSCPDVNLLDNDSSVSLVSEIDELYKQITIRDRRYKKRSYSPHNARHGQHNVVRHCESDSCISESHSDILDNDQKAETRV